MQVSLFSTKFRFPFLKFGDFRFPPVNHLLLVRRCAPNFRHRFLPVLHLHFILMVSLKVCHSSSFLQQVSEIPRKRSEILGLEMERDVDYHLVRRYPRRRKKHYNCSPTVPLLLLLIGVIIFAIGYISYSIILGTQEFELEGTVTHSLL